MSNVPKIPKKDEFSVPTSSFLIEFTKTPLSTLAQAEKLDDTMTNGCRLKMTKQNYFLLVLSSIEFTFYVFGF